MATNKVDVERKRSCEYDESIVSQYFWMLFVGNVSHNIDASFRSLSELSKKVGWLFWIKRSIGRVKELF